MAEGEPAGRERLTEGIPMTDEKTGNIKDTQLEIRRVYVKDLSFESPQAPNAFAGGEKNPAIDVQLGVEARALDEGGRYHEVVLVITVTARTGDSVLFLNEVQQAGVFELKGFTPEEQDLVLHIACPNILLPFARSVVADVVARGGFPQLLINPVNFEVLYAQKIKRDQEKAGPTDASQPESGDGSSEGTTLN